jgi:hypothetical protein
MVNSIFDEQKHWFHAFPVGRFSHYDVAFFHDLPSRGAMLAAFVQLRSSKLGALGVGLAKMGLSTAPWPMALDPRRTGIAGICFGMTIHG